jgi:Lrp/AsnC family transcriptional regulator for asnA, asnC and gidA
LQFRRWAKIEYGTNAGSVRFPVLQGPGTLVGKKRKNPAETKPEPAQKARFTGVSSIDLRIIECLQSDARMTVSKIAAAIEEPESTVRNRLNKLIDTKTIEFATLVDPLKFGYQIWAIIEIQVATQNIRSVAKSVAEIPEVYFVGITTGGREIFANAIFRSNEELLDFLDGPLARIPGIIRTSTSNILQLVKRKMTLTDVHKQLNES